MLFPRLKGLASANPIFIKMVRWARAYAVIVPFFRLGKHKEFPTGALCFSKHATTLPFEIGVFVVVFRSVVGKVGGWNVFPTVCPHGSKSASVVILALVVVLFRMRT